jgi:hypothetical protein
MYLGHGGTLTWGSPSSTGASRVLLGKEKAKVNTTSGDYGNISFVYDPSDPAPTYGGWIFAGSNMRNGSDSVGSVDQSPLGSRKDVLQYNTAPLQDDLALCGGDITATLTVGSTANDTDFIATLVDQHPTGERYLVAQGIIRMRWRERGLTPVPMLSGHTYEVDIDMWSTCWVFGAGHRVGIDITSSSSFMYLPNPNTGLPLQPDGIWPAGGEFYTGENITATNTVVYGASKISLPVVNKKDLPVMPAINIPGLSAPPSTAKLMEMGREALLQKN